MVLELEICEDIAEDKNGRRYSCEDIAEVDTVVKIIGNHTFTLFQFHYVQTQNGNILVSSIVSAHKKKQLWMMLGYVRAMKKK